MKAQEKIEKILESEHYPSFLVTEEYQRLSQQPSAEEQSNHNRETDQNENSKTNRRERVLTAQSSFSSLHANDSITDPNKKQIESLKEKLSMKVSALNAIKTTNKQSQEDSKLILILEKDIKKLRHDISIYETHIQNTEVWCENLGKWITKVNNAVIKQTSHNSGDKEVLFEIHVQLQDNSASKQDELKVDVNNQAYLKEGWIIYRNLKQFEKLNDVLIEFVPKEKKHEFKKLPHLKRNLLSKHLSEEKIKQVTLVLDEYLKVLH